MITISILMSQIALAEVLTETSDICSPVLQQIWKDKILKNRYFPKNRNLMLATFKSCCYFSIPTSVWLQKKF